MHSVNRSPEPDYWNELKAQFNEWGDLGSPERSQIRDSLALDFGPICGYCERPCHSPRGATDSPDGETIDHFRPRSRFPDLAFEWRNLVYACHRCNQIKGDQWPLKDDNANITLAALYPERYLIVEGYVNPSEDYGEVSTREFFRFDLDTGEISPSNHLERAEWSMARRTILDIDLNDNGDSSPGENDEQHLWNRRKDQLNLLIGQLNTVGSFEEMQSILRQFTLPDKPFSSFIAAYRDSLMNPEA